MASGRKLSAKDYEQIILLDLYGKTAREIEQELDISNSTASSTTRAFKAVKKGDWDVIVDMIYKGATNLVFLNWAAEKLKVELPEIVMEAYYTKYPTKRPIVPKKEPEKKEEPEEKPDEQLSMDDVVVKSSNENKFFETVLKQQQQEHAILTTIGRVLAGIANTLTSTMSNVKYIKENNDRNTTLICDKLKQVNDRLDTIERLLR